MSLCNTTIFLNFLSYQQQTTKSFQFVCVPLTQPNLLEHTNTLILWQICNDNNWDWVTFQGCPKTFFHRCRLVSFLVGRFCCDLNKTTWKASNLLSGAAMSEPGRPERLCSFTVKIPPQKAKFGVARSSVLPCEGASCSTSEPCILQMSLSAPLAASALIIGEKTERHWYHIGRHDLRFVRWQGALRRKKQN